MVLFSLEAKAFADPLGSGRGPLGVRGPQFKNRCSKIKSITIHESEVERVSKTIYLGVCIDENLTFNCHISKALSKVYYIVSSFAYVVSFFNQSAKETVFRSVILPHIIYAVPVWYHFISCKDKNRIIKFLKYTSQILNIDSCSLIEMINDSAKSEFVRMTNKIRNDESHPLHTVLTGLLKKSERNLRNPNILPKFRIQLYKNSFVYRAAIFLQSNQLQPFL